MAQVTSVSQLSDVQPTDWAFQALQSLVERYGCIAGYPDSTYRGQRALTRYEFAAGLNACMQRIEELLSATTSPLLTKEELLVLQKLQEEFAAELVTMRGRVDTLEARTTQLEAQQFSTTTKLNGEAIFAVVGGSGGEPRSRTPAGEDPQPIMVNRVRLNLVSSFTGKDLLITGLQSYNFSSVIAGGSSVQEVLFPNAGSPLSEGNTKLNFEPQFPGFNPQNLTSSCGGNDVCLYKLLYIFPVAKKLTLFAAPLAEVSDAFPTLLPWASEGQGAISRFVALNPVLRVSGGTSGTGLASAAGFIFIPTPKVDWRALYGSVNAPIPANGPFPENVLGAGLFNGSFVASTQLTLKPAKTLDIGLNYAYSYHQVNILGMGLAGLSTGSLAGLPITTPVHLNSVGATLTWRFHPKVSLATYGAYIMVNNAAGDGYTNFTSWLLGFYFPDALVKGNTAAIMFGQPLYRVAAGGGASLTPSNSFTGGPSINRATPYQVEAYYNIRLNDYISVTPGAFVIFNPEGDSNNLTTGVAVIRTTFTF
ncbi:iron uptake porin [Neosynechococcus sphagnicola]|nr:iron uptake porin [Neosynechococcus sphagnicola]